MQWTINSGHNSNFISSFYPSPFFAVISNLWDINVGCLFSDNCFNSLSVFILDLVNFSELLPTFQVFPENVALSVKRKHSERFLLTSIPVFSLVQFLENIFFKNLCIYLTGKTSTESYLQLKSYDQLEELNENIKISYLKKNYIAFQSYIYSLLMEYQDLFSNGAQTFDLFLYLYARYDCF